MIPHPPRLRWLATLASVAVASGCSDPPPPTARTLEGAFERVAAAIDAGDAKRLYWDLELETRWSLMTIHRNQRRIQDLVAADYPTDERARAVGRWRTGAEAADPGVLFAELCAARDCLEPLREKIGAIARVERTPGGGVVRTIPGGVYRFKKGQDGRFGLQGFRDELATLERDVNRDLAVIERAASEYRRARAGGSAGPAHVTVGLKGR
jgi:hypothetical protein